MSSRLCPVSSGRRRASRLRGPSQNPNVPLTPANHSPASGNPPLVAQPRCVVGVTDGQVVLPRRLGSHGQEGVHRAQRGARPGAGRLAGELAQRRVRRGSPGRADRCGEPPPQPCPRSSWRTTSAARGRSTDPRGSDAPRRPRRRGTAPPPWRPRSGITVTRSDLRHDGPERVEVLGPHDPHEHGAHECVSALRDRRALVDGGHAGDELVHAVDVASHGLPRDLQAVEDQQRVEVPFAERLPRVPERRGRPSPPRVRARKRRWLPG